MGDELDGLKMEEIMDLARLGWRVLAQGREERWKKLLKPKRKRKSKDGEILRVGTSYTGH